jgi:hypothetical protein
MITKYYVGDFAAWLSAIEKFLILNYLILSIYRW